MAKKIKLPYCVKPCKDCPFRKDSLKGWLGSERMKEILNANSFTCHKSNKKLQCAGHMIIKKHDNDFYNLAHRMKIDLPLENQNFIFDSEKECIDHHKKIKLI